MTGAVIKKETPAQEDGGLASWVRYFYSAATIAGSASLAFSSAISVSMLSQAR